MQGDAIVTGIRGNRHMRPVKSHHHHKHIFTSSQTCAAGQPQCGQNLQKIDLVYQAIHQELQGLVCFIFAAHCFRHTRTQNTHLIRDKQALQKR